MKPLLVLLLLSIASLAHSQTITTIAGDGSYVTTGNGDLAGSAGVKAPNSITIDSSGNVYIAEFWSSCIRKIDNYGFINAFAGNGTAGHSGDNGPATAAQLSYPEAVTSDKKGNIYIVDVQLIFDITGSYSVSGTYIRKVDAAGIITTIAGNNTTIYSGDSGLATNAGFDITWDVAADNKGNVYTSEYSRIRKIDTAGIITTIAGQSVPGYSGDSGLAINASIGQQGIATDNKGNIYIADMSNRRIRKIDSTGIIVTVAGCDSDTYGISTGDGGPATSAVTYPFRLTVDDTGNIYFTEVPGRVRKVDTAGMINTVVGNGVPGYAGDGGPPTAAEISDPYGVAIDSLGNLFIADRSNNRIREVYIYGPLSVPYSTPEKQTLQIWPEPNSGLFNIFIASAITQPATIIITDISGQQVMQLTTTTNKATAITLHAPAGIYSVSTIASGQTQSSIVILQ